MLYNIAAMLAVLTAPAADPIKETHKAYRNCLFTLHNENIRTKTSLPEFRKLADAGCMVERDAYRGVIVKSERSFGSSVAEANSYADEEVQALISGIKANYAENLETGATITLES